MIMLLSINVLMIYEFTKDIRPSVRATIPKLSGIFEISFHLGLALCKVSELTFDLKSQTFGNIYFLNGNMGWNFVH